MMISFHVLMPSNENQKESPETGPTGGVYYCEAEETFFEIFCRSFEVVCGGWMVGG